MSHTIYRNVVIKKVVLIDGKRVERPTKVYDQVMKKVGEHIAKGGNVDIDHRRREDAVSVKTGEAVEVMDVRLH